MAFKKTFYMREFPQKKKLNYSEQEVIFHLEILPLNRKSIIITNQKK